MRLYVSSKGEWFGTQRDAQRSAPRDWREVEVPTSKNDLINYLSANKVGSTAAPEAAPAPAPEFTSELLTNDAYSWVKWALDKLVTGDRSGAKEMLNLGLKEQALGLKRSGAMTSDGFLVKTGGQS